MASSQPAQDFELAGAASPKITSERMLGLTRVAALVAAVVPDGETIGDVEQHAFVSLQHQLLQVAADRL